MRRLVVPLLLAAIFARADLVEESGIKGGLVVHVGCGDGALTSTLRKGDAYVVHGLDTDAANVRKARRAFRAAGLNGSVSAAAFGGRQLPYVDNSVNLVVADALGDVPADEVTRVLAPAGVAMVGGKKTVKPRPPELDDWSHFLHGADGNMVSRDTTVDFPHHIQWVGSPKHSRDHEFATSMDVIVSAGGRLFYILDEGPTALPYHLPSRWILTARDAFNGVVLWKRPLPVWRPYSVPGRKSLAADLWRRLVAAEDEVYVTSSIFGPVAALDAATGKTVRTYEGTEKTEEIILAGGVLYLVVNTSDPEKIDRRALAAKRTVPDRKRLMAVKADTGKILWVKEDADTDGVHPLTLAAAGKRVVFQNSREIVCLDPKSGKVAWRYARPSEYARLGYTAPTLVISGDVVLSADRSGRRAKPVDKKARSACELIAICAGDGKELWRCPCGETYRIAVDVFVAKGLVWCSLTQPNGAHYSEARNLLTGKVEKTISPWENWPTWHHHRCYRIKATERYILAGRTGIEFVDLDSGELTTHHWIRGICQNGILPGNGLIYSPPDQCACYIESKLHGFHAIAPKRKRTTVTVQKAGRIEKGGAYSQISDFKSQIANPRFQISDADWPTLRYDNSRSACVAADLSLELEPLWSRKLGGKLTSLVCAAGRLYVARPEQHTVLCLDAESGKALWRYAAGARVDSPPTIANGIAVFGCRDGWVYALRVSDGELAWRFRAAPEDLNLVEKGQVASVWPVHGSVLVEDGSVFFAAGRSSYLDNGMYLYKLDLLTGEVQAEKNYYARDPKSGETRFFYTPFDSELLRFREHPGLLPDVMSWDGKNIYMRSVPMGRDLVIKDKEYVHHLFSSMGFLEDTWWERTYWVYGAHFYSGARGHGYAKTLYPAGRLLVFDDQSVYGYQDHTLNSKAPHIFSVPKNPEFVDLSTRIKVPKVGRKPKKSGKKSGKNKPVVATREALSKYVWKDGMPTDARAMDLGKNRPLGDAVRRVVKYDLTWQKDVPLYPNAMLLANKTFFMAGAPRFDEQTAFQINQSANTDSFEPAPPLRDAVDTFAGKKGGLLLAVDKTNGGKLAQIELPSCPVFDGMITAGGRLFLAMKDGSIVCLGEK